MPNELDEALANLPSVESPKEEWELLGDNPELLEVIMNEKLGTITVFKDPILQYQYEQLLNDEEKLLSLDDIIAMGKVRLNVAMRKAKNVEVAHLTRSIVDAVEKAVYIRERHKEFVHLEQLLVVLDMLFEIVSEEVSDQREVNKVAERLAKLRLPSRDDVPLEKKKLARALVEGKRTVDRDA